jgi:hypothetical protein
MKEFSYDFKMSSTSDVDSQLVFKLGGNNNDVFIDEVSLFKGIDYSQISVYLLKNHLSYCKVNQIINLLIQ